MHLLFHLQQILKAKIVDVKAIAQMKVDIYKHASYGTCLEIKLGSSLGSNLRPTINLF